MEKFVDDLVSIIIPAYNAEKYIKDTITSVIKQTYTKWEMVIVDDASKDNTNKIIKEYQQKDKRIKLIILFLDLKITLWMITYRTYSRSLFSNNNMTTISTLPYSISLTRKY